MSIPISRELSAKIRVLSFVCSLFVILLHAYAISISDTNCPIHIIKRFLSVGLSGIAVPFFFVVSGFMLAHQYDSGVPYQNLLKKRWFSLGKPYLLWNIIYTFTYVAFTILGNYLAKRALNVNTSLVLPILKIQNIFRVFGINLFHFPSNGPLWYVRNLILLVVISPLILSLLGKQKKGLIFLLLVTLLYLSHFLIPRPWWQFFQTGFSFKGLLFFSIGIYLKRYPIEWRPTLFGALFICILWFLMAWPWSFSLDFAFIILHCSFIIGCIAIWFIYDYLPFRSTLEHSPIIKYSFFVYVSHYAILNMLFCQKAYNIYIKVLKSEIILYVLCFAVTASLAITFAYLLEHFFPKIYNSLTGNR